MEQRFHQKQDGSCGKGQIRQDGAFDVKLTAEDVAYLEEMYVPHPVVGAIDANPPHGVLIIDDKK